MHDRLVPLRSRALRAWAQADPTMAALARRHPQRVPEPARSAFESLVVSLLHQQVSMAAGRTITGRVWSACGGKITPARVLALGDAGLAPMGVSRQKRGYILDLAARQTEGSLRLETLHRATDELVIERLTRSRGIGPWTAKMFLMFHLQRPDVVAPEDLGLRIAFARAYHVDREEAPQRIVERSDAWRPYRTLACFALWSSLDGPG